MTCKNGPNRRLLESALVGCGATIVFCWIFNEPITRDESHFNRLILSLVACFIVIAVFAGHLASARFRRFPVDTAKRLTRSVLIITCVAGVLNYFQFDSRLLLRIGDVADVTYYYVNSKYFSELGYFDLYPAILIADEENSNRMEGLSRYRDLRTYEMTDTSTAFRERQRIKSTFSGERWVQFCHDIDFFLRHRPSGGWSYFFSDHGYNPPPTWTIVGGTLSRLVPVENIRVLTSIDILLVTIMFMIIGTTFSFETLLFTLLFFVVTFSGRWPILGHSLLRFDWLAATVIAVCMLKQGRTALSGGLIAYASLSRIFPFVFALPVLAGFAFDTYHKRRLTNDVTSFVIGAGIVSVLQIGAALFILGPNAFHESAKNLVLHNSPKSFSSHRVGLGDTLVFRGETTRDEMNDHGGIRGKASQLASLRPWTNGVGFISLALVSLYIWRTNKPSYQTMWLGAIPLFCMTTPQINYYNLRLLLVLHHLEAPQKLRNALGLLVLFGIEAIAQWTKVNGFERYTTTSVTSVGLLAYYVLVVGFLVFVDVVEVRLRPSKR